MLWDASYFVQAKTSTTVELPFWRTAVAWCRFHYKCDTMNIFPSLIRLLANYGAPLNTSISLQHIIQFICQFCRSRNHYSYKESNTKRTRGNTTAVNRVHCATGRLYCMMNCFSLHFQFRFIEVVSPITQSWAAHTKQRHTATGFLMYGGK